MFKKISILFVPLFISFFGAVHAQQSAEPVSQENQIIDVIKVYELVVADGYESAQIFETLATEHFFKKNYLDAKKWFEKLFLIEKNPEPIAYFRYAKSLEALEDYNKADQYLAIYHAKTNK